MCLLSPFSLSLVAEFSTYFEFCRLKCGYFCVPTVVNQMYDADILKEFVIRGNTGILKCSIPSFVADFVHVDAWISDDGSIFEPASNRFGTNAVGVERTRYWSVFELCVFALFLFVNFRPSSVCFVYPIFALEFPVKLRFDLRSREP